MSQKAAARSSTPFIKANSSSFHRLNAAYVELHLLLLALGAGVSRGTGFLITGYGGETRFV